MKLNSLSPDEIARTVCVPAAAFSMWRPWNATRPEVDLRVRMHPAWSESTFMVRDPTGGCITNLCTALGRPSRYRPHRFAISHANVVGVDIHLASSLAVNMMSGRSCAR